MGLVLSCLVAWGVCIGYSCDYKVFAFALGFVFVIHLLSSTFVGREIGGIL